MTTSVTALLHLDWAAAWKAHPFGPVLYLAFTVSAIVGAIGWWKKTRLDTGTRPFQRALMLFTVAFAVFGIVRFSRVTYKSSEFAVAQKFISNSGREKGR